MKKFLGFLKDNWIFFFIALLIIGVLSDDGTRPAKTKKWDPVKVYGLETTWWEETVWFFEDLFESDNDEEIKQLKSRIKELERKSDNSKSITDAINDLKMQLILLDD